MNKRNKVIIVIDIFVAIILCACCFLLGKKDVKSTSLYVDDGMIKYKSDGIEDEIMSIEDLLNSKNNSSLVDGKTIEFSIKEGYIVWNYTNESEYNKLMKIEDLVGKQGETGASGENGVKGKDGIDGKNAYIWIKYLDNAPSDSNDIDLKDIPCNYMGIYYGSSSEAPTKISEYKWFFTKGEKGDKGDSYLANYAIYTYKTSGNKNVMDEVYKRKSMPISLIDGVLKVLEAGNYVFEIQGDIVLSTNLSGIGKEINVTFGKLGTDKPSIFSGSIGPEAFDKNVITTITDPNEIKENSTKIIKVLEFNDVEVNSEFLFEVTKEDINATFPQCTVDLIIRVYKV